MSRIVPSLPYVCFHFLQEIRLADIMSFVIFAFTELYWDEIIEEICVEKIETHTKF